MSAAGFARGAKDSPRGVVREGEKGRELFVLSRRRDVSKGLHLSARYENGVIQRRDELHLHLDT